MCLYIYIYIFNHTKLLRLVWIFVSFCFQSNIFFPRTNFRFLLFQMAENIFGKWKINIDFKSKNTKKMLEISIFLIRRTYEDAYEEFSLVSRSNIHNSSYKIPWICRPLYLLEACFQLSMSVLSPNLAWSKTNYFH